MQLVKEKRGFTLIELLVVVAIIGVLATIVLGALNEARAKARDARRQSDIKTIQNALEMYYLDHGEYPGGSGWFRSNASTWATLENAMNVTLPRDPVNSGGFPHSAGDGSTYAYKTEYDTTTIACPSGQGYVLIYRVESRVLDVSESGGVMRCNTGTLRTYSNNTVTVGISPPG